jgi:hypothetical protein
MTESNPSRPPIGIEPEYIWKTKRLHELVLAAGRLIDAGRDVNFQWYLEMSKLVDDLDDHRQQQQKGNNQ